VRLWIMSDLHMESTRGWDLPSGRARPDFDVLVVAGDLTTRMERGAKWLLERVSDKPVVYVPGNHEAYGADIDRTVEKAMEAAAGTKLFVLQDRAISLGGATFAGCCLWTDFNLFGDRRLAMSIAGARMNDFRKIRTAKYRERFMPRHALARHRRSRAFLETELRKSRGAGKLVVVSHHAPDPGRFQGPVPDPLAEPDILTSAYRSDLTEMMWPAPVADGKNALRPADVWIHGHTHESFDGVIGSTRIVSNAKGYGPWPGHPEWDNPNFDPNFVIDI
jgi:predicted phosphodiesterase